MIYSEKTHTIVCDSIRCSRSYGSGKLFYKKEELVERAKKSGWTTKENGECYCLYHSSKEKV